MSRAVSLFCVAILLGACTQPPVRAPSEPEATVAELAAAIDSLYAQLVAAAQSGDAQAYADTYSPTGAVLLPNIPAVTGRDEVAAWARQFFATWDVQIDTLVFDDRQIGTTLGFARYWARGRYLPKAGGSVVPFHQKYMDTFVRDGAGAWKLAAHMVSSNQKAASIWD